MRTEKKSINKIIAVLLAIVLTVQGFGGIPCADVKAAENTREFTALNPIVYLYGATGQSQPDNNQSVSFHVDGVEGIGSIPRPDPPTHTVEYTPVNGGGLYYNGVKNDGIKLYTWSNNGTTDSMQFVMKWTDSDIEYKEGDKFRIEGQFERTESEVHYLLDFEFAEFQWNGSDWTQITVNRFENLTPIVYGYCQTNQSKPDVNQNCSVSFHVDVSGIGTIPCTYTTWDKEYTPVDGGGMYRNGTQDDKMKLYTFAASGNDSMQFTMTWKYSDITTCDNGDRFKIAGKFEHYEGTNLYILDFNATEFAYDTSYEQRWRTVQETVFKGLSPVVYRYDQTAQSKPNVSQSVSFYVEGVSGIGTIPYTHATRDKKYTPINGGGMYRNGTRDDKMELYTFAGTGNDKMQFTMTWVSSDITTCDTGDIFKLEGQFEHYDEANFHRYILDFNATEYMWDASLSDTGDWYTVQTARYENLTSTVYPNISDTSKSCSTSVSFHVDGVEGIDTIPTNTDGLIIEYTSLENGKIYRNQTAEDGLKLYGFSTTSATQSAQFVITWQDTEKQEAAKDDVIQIQGQFVYESKNATTKKCNRYIVDFQPAAFQWDGTSDWSSTETFDPDAPIASTELQVTGIHTQGFQDNSSRVWLETSQTIPSGNYTGLTVEIDGTPFTGLLEAMNDNNYLFLILWGYNITTAKDGTVITLKAGTGVNENGNITITEDFVMYAENGKFTTQEPITYTNFNVTGLTSDLGFDAVRSVWNGYFTVDADLPGTAWTDRFPITIDVDGVKTTVEAMKGNRGELHFTIPVATLPVDTDRTVTIKTGSYACKDSSVRLGYTIASDFTFYASKHGWSTNNKILDANVLKGVKAVVSDSQEGTAGFVINTNLEDGVVVDGWSSRIYPARKGASNGQTVYFDKDNGVKVGAVYQDKPVELVKIGEKRYYVGLADGGITATTGVEYTVGGVFYDTDGKLIEFEPVTAVRNGENASDWMGVIKDTEVEGDINGDNVADSCDLVRMLRYYSPGSKIAVNQARLDVNCDGNKDVKDIPSLRKVLLRAIYYNRADEEGLANSPYGTPVYKRNQTIERTAYISPEATDENFARYKEAGFTLLETQKVAWYQDALPNEEKQAKVVAYLEKAQQYGLGVLVYSVPIHNMIVEADNDAFYYGEDARYKTILQEEVTFLKKYPAFKGFFFGDEVSKERVEQYNKVAAYLLKLDPDLILFNSQLGLYDTKAGHFSDTIKDKKEAYLDYIGKFSSATNRFVYDTYTLEYHPLTGKYGVSEEWYDNLSYVAQYVKGKLPTRQIKTGVTIQACQPDITKPSHTYRYAPTKQADIGFQVYTALAYGMDEINYYKYEAHDGDKYASNFIGDNEDVYNAVKAVNAELDSFGHVFKAFSWKDTLDIKAGGSNKSTGNARLQSAASNGGRAFVGCMKDSDGFDGYMVANAEGPRAGKTATVTLTFKSATKAMIYKGTSCETVSLTGGVCPVTLEAGEGAFIIPIR